MKMRRSLKLLTLAIIYLTSTAQFCGPPPAQGPVSLNVPYQSQQTYYWCVPAVTWMTTAYIDGGWTSHTQQSIWSWMQGMFPGDVQSGVGVTNPNAITFALRWYLGDNSIIQAQYPYASRQQAVADQDKRMRVNKPTIVTINDFTHAVIVVGSKWRRLADAMQRPAGEIILVHDPASGPYVNLSLGTWMNQLMPSPSRGNIVWQWVPSGDLNAGTLALQQFDVEGGVYEGPPPPDPTGRYRFDGNGNCYWEWNDFGDHQCSPSGGGGGGGGGFATVMNAGDRLYGGQYIDSPDGRFRLTYQVDGNLVLYGPVGSQVQWATMTFGAPGFTEMQSDGNLVVYDSGGTPVWNSGTYGIPGARLDLQNDGNLVIYAGVTAVWHTNTCCW